MTKITETRDNAAARVAESSSTDRSGGVRVSIRMAVVGLAAAAALLVGQTPAQAGWQDNPNNGSVLICDRSGACFESAVKFNCRAGKNRTDVKIWARYCARR